MTLSDFLEIIFFLQEKLSKMIKIIRHHKTDQKHKENNRKHQENDQKRLIFHFPIDSDHN